MPANDNEATSSLLRKLERLAPLSDDDKDAIAALSLTEERVRAGRHLVREGMRITNCCLLVEGFACRYKMIEDGRRQIVSFHIRGDILDIQHLMLDTADHHVQAATDATIAWIPVAELQDLALHRPNLGRALWRDALIDASIFREWVLNVGRRDARSRIAHMLCELAARARAMGLGVDGVYTLPLSQEQIADATGLTAVHVNRMLRLLREEGALHVGNREVRIVDMNLLSQIAAFDPAYLHAAA